MRKRIFAVAAAALLGAATMTTGAMALDHGGGAAKRTGHWARVAWRADPHAWRANGRGLPFGPPLERSTPTVQVTPAIHTILSPHSMAIAAVPTITAGEHGNAALLRRGGLCLSLLSAEAAAIVRQHEIEHRPDRHDAGRVHVAMAAVIVPLDVIEAHGLGDARHLIKLAQIIPDRLG